MMSSSTGFKVLMSKMVLLFKAGLDPLWDVRDIDLITQACVAGLPDAPSVVYLKAMGSESAIKRTDLS